MEKLVKFKNGNSVTTSKLIALKFRKRHSDVLRAIESLNCTMEFRQRNFALMLESRELPNGGSTNDSVYTITRDGFTFLAMGFTGAKAAMFKEDFINAFNEMEKRIKEINETFTPPQKQLPQNYVEALRELADEVERRELAETKVKELSPKAEVFDRISNTDNLLTMNAAAKSLGISRPKLFAVLRGRNVLMANNLPYQLFIDKGLFQVKDKVIQMGDRSMVYPQTFVTGKGVAWIGKGLIKLEKEQ